MEEESLGTRRVSTEQQIAQGARTYKGCGIVSDTESGRALVECLAPTPRLILFGAGHVSAATAGIATGLGYLVTVVDDRPEWNTPVRFPNVRERVLEPYEDFLDVFEPLPTDSVLIITQGHDFDQMILEFMVDKALAYLGMIGSDTKVSKAMKKLEAKGVPHAVRTAVQAPIGLDIGALTPEEIAISIAAELVQKRRIG